jgi:hypothetical protein
MSSVRRILSSRANGARSAGPVTPRGKSRSSQNATSHGLLARHLLMRDESPQCFETVLNDHLTRLQPVDGLEFGMVEEMVASHWRLRRAWAIETRLLENEAARTSGDPLDRIANAFESLAAKPALGLMHRYQTRLHLNYQRALHNMLLLRAVAAVSNAVPSAVLDAVPNEPSPISGHLPPAPPDTVVICLPTPAGTN